MTKVGKLESNSLSDCTDNIIKEGIVIPANDSAIIDIRVYLSEDIQNSEIGKSFYAKLSIDGLAVYNENDDIDNSILQAPSSIIAKFNATGGTVTTTSKEVMYGETYGELPTPTKEGYTFAGWYTEETGGEEITSESIVESTEGQTLYARWTLNSYYFDLNWNLDGSNYSATTLVTAGLKVDGVDQGYISDYYVQHPYGTTWEIYGVKLNGTLISYAANGTIGASYTNHAIDINTLTIGVNDSSYGTISSSSLYVLRNATYTTSGSTLTLSDGRTVTASTTAATGYNTAFSGWSPSSGTISAATTVTANFSRTKKTFTVTFNANGGSVSTSSKSVTYGDEYGDLPTPTYSGYTFLGWYTAATDGTKIVSTSTVSITANQTLYAQWVLTSKTFNYTGEIQTFTVPVSGTYKLEVCGAQGGTTTYGSTTASGGKGGYSYGSIYLNEGQILYIGVGQQPTDSSGGYNGGGYEYLASQRGGGGATHIATATGLLSSLSSNKSAVLIVAGGGGGAALSWQDSAYNSGGGGTGGGTSGNAGASNGNGSGTGGTGGTQSSGYSFGQGGAGTGNSTTSSVGTKYAVSGGGGGGYYGGTGGTATGGTGTSGGRVSGGGGGSGYIGGISEGSTTNGQCEGNGYAIISYQSSTGATSSYDAVATTTTYDATSSSSTYTASQEDYVCYYCSAPKYTCPDGSVGYGTDIAGHLCPGEGVYDYTDCQQYTESTCQRYTCPNGGTLSGTTCTVTTYSCPNGGTLNGTVCEVTTYSCPAGGTLSGTTCVVS